MTVYGDLLFLINFSMDFLCFYITSLLLHRRLPLLRAAISSALGGVYSVASLFLTVGKGVATVIDLSACLVMCAIVFCEKKGGTKRVIGGSALYLFVSMVVGGVMTALYSIMNRSELLSGGVQSDEGITVWIFAVLAIISGVATVFGGRFFRASSSEREVTLELGNLGKRVRIRALSDSGNLVRDPISGRAVIIATLRSSGELIPCEMLPAFENACDIERLPISVASKIRLIPTSGVVGESLLAAIRINEIKVIYGGGKREKSLDALVSFVDKNDFSGYDAVIPQEVMI